MNDEYISRYEAVCDKIQIHLVTRQYENVSFSTLVTVLQNLFILRIFNSSSIWFNVDKFILNEPDVLGLIFLREKSLTSCLFINSRTKDCINCLLQINKSQKVNVLSELKI